MCYGSTSNICWTMDSRIHAAEHNTKRPRCYDNEYYRPRTKRGSRCRARYECSRLALHGGWASSSLDTAGGGGLGEMEDAVDRGGFEETHHVKTQWHWEHHLPECVCVHVYVRSCVCVPSKFSVAYPHHESH